MTFVRGSNPVWSFVDLTGHQFDDTFFMFVLQNTLPYIPATVYNTPSGIPWTNPIQFLANGTLPVDIYWDPDVVYRLEFRKGNTQSDPLIYLVENYSPGGNGDTPIDTTAIATDNQITNPQFSLLSFESPFTLTGATNPDPIEVAPGWFLNLTGTGNVTLEQVPLDSTEANPTNAPYALRITLNGAWTGSPYLSQTFSGNGMLWSTYNDPRYVSNSVTAKLQGAPISISAQLYDSMGTALSTVLNSSLVTETFNELVDHGLMPTTTNTDIPPDASIQYRLFLPQNVDIYLSSIQLVTSLSINNFNYIQDTIERQQDYTFHYYRPSLLRRQKESILTGWDFGLNPWQFYPTATTNLATFGYTADQTIMIQQAYVQSATGNNISTARGSAAQNYGFRIRAVTATNQFAMIQYVDPATIRGLWGRTVSSYVTMRSTLQNTGINLGVKMRLIYRTSLPSTISQTEPIASWTAGGEPVFSAGWTSIAPQNDPVYTLIGGNQTLTFEGMVLPTSTSDNMTLGYVIYTLGSMIQSGTADIIIFNRISLVQNDFAIETQSLTYDETFKQCQYYYETSYAPAGSAGTSGPQRSTTSNALTYPLATVSNGTNSRATPLSFSYPFQTIKRASPSMSFYSLNATSANSTAFIITNNTVVSAGANIVNGTYYASTAATTTNLTFQADATVISTLTTVDASTSASAWTKFHFVADARLGL